jgi:AcrR family transcriptional regulator
MYLDKQTQKEYNTYQTNEMKGGRYMARNKYPEITVEKILEVSQRLFMEKGYDNTTIQDIVNELGGLTKGAIYHHFKSKEEIIDALGGKLFFDNNPFVTVQNQKNLNGLEKMREVIKLNHADNDRTELGKQSIPLLKNPRLLAELADTNRKLIAPLWLQLIQEGIADGSIQTGYAKELSELLPLLTNFWLIPSVYPATPEELLSKFAFIKYLLDSMNLPIIDDEIFGMVQNYFEHLNVGE